MNTQTNKQEGKKTLVSETVLVRIEGLDEHDVVVDPNKGFATMRIRGDKKSLKIYDYRYDPRTNFQIYKGDRRPESWKKFMDSVNDYAQATVRQREDGEIYVLLYDHDKGFLPTAMLVALLGRGKGITVLIPTEGGWMLNLGNKIVVLTRDRDGADIWIPGRNGDDEEEEKEYEVASITFEVSWQPKMHYDLMRQMAEPPTT